MARCAKSGGPKLSSKGAKRENFHGGEEEGILDLQYSAPFFRYYDLIQSLWSTMACSWVSLVFFWDTKNNLTMYAIRKSSAIER